jgi:hypothetical protein
MSQIPDTWKVPGILYPSLHINAVSAGKNVIDFTVNDKYLL